MHQARISALVWHSLARRRAYPYRKAIGRAIVCLKSPSDTISYRIFMKYQLEAVIIFVKVVYIYEMRVINNRIVMRKAQP